MTKVAKSINVKPKKDTKSAKPIRKAQKTLKKLWDRKKLAVN